MCSQKDKLKFSNDDLILFAEDFASLNTNELNCTFGKSFAIFLEAENF